MKKIIFAIIMGLTITACNEKESQLQPPSEHTATLLASDSKQSSNYFISTKCGHLAKDCNNSCITSGGFTFHVDCMGRGYICDPTASIAVTAMPNSSFYQAVTIGKGDFTGDDFFLMPDRSLDIEGGSYFLNIPEQLIYRDSISGQFTLYDLFYTNYQYYDNE